VLYKPDGDTDDSYDVGWFGHCHAWSAASILEPEPFTATKYTGIDFAVGDQKGLLTELHCNDSLDLRNGTRYNGPGDDPNDIYPCYFHNVLINWTGLKRKPLVMDIATFERAVKSCKI